MLPSPFLRRNHTQIRVENGEQVTLTPAFNSLDMVEIIETHQPALWVYGHTHECDDQMIGRTRIISNQLGYPGSLGGFECKDFDEAGLPVEVGV